VTLASQQLLPAPPAALAAAELTEEQSLIVEAWATVQRGYVDQSFGGTDWKAVKSEYLKRKYHSISAAREAVSEMLSLLGDRCVLIYGHGPNGRAPEPEPA
jgi:C-terminal processing protease CtpA/Prc